MNKQLKYILFILFLSHFNSGISKEIQIDSGFSSIDIYNKLENSDKHYYNDILFNLVLVNRAATEQQLYLSIINPTIDKIIIKEDNKVEVLGDMIPFTQRKFKHTNHVYPVLLKANETKKIELIVTNQFHKEINFRVNLASENTFIKITNHDNFFNGIFYGILFMFILILICIYIFNKSNFFIIYLIINICMLILYLQYNGTGYQFIWFYSSTIQRYIGVFAVIGYLSTHMSFILSFFSIQIKIFSKIFLKIFFVVFIISICVAFIQLHNHSYSFIYTNSYFLLLNSIFLIYSIAIIVICLYSYKETKSREIIWVLVGALLHISNWTIFINNQFGQLKWLNYLDNYKLFQSNIFVPQINYYISLIEILVITVFISINYYKIIRQNDTSAKRVDFYQKININTFVLGQEDEREKISKMIDTSIAKDIRHLKHSLLNLNPAYFKKETIAHLINEIDKSVEDIHNITSNYVAPDMQNMKFKELLSTSTEKLYHQVNLNFEFKNISDSFQLNAVANINLYRVFQEISNNILKHSSARNVQITSINDNKTLQVKIVDDGIGFPRVGLNNKGIGLMNIDSRLKSLNGNFYILSNEKNGSTIDLIMTLKDIT